MKIRALQEWQHSQNETMHFEAGKVYEVPDELGARLVKDYGPTSQNVTRGQQPIFEKVEDVEAVKAVKAPPADFIFDGTSEPVAANARVRTGESGTTDHRHVSDSELQHVDEDAEERVQGLETAGVVNEGDAEREEKRSANAGKSGPSGDTLSTDVGAKK